jgi:hypothetical protein
MPVTQDNPTVFDLIPGVLNWEPPDISQGSPSHMDRVYNLFGVRKALKEGWRHFDEGLLARDQYSQKYNGKTTSRFSGDNSRVNVPLEFGDALINYRLDPTNNLISGLVFNLSPQDQSHMTSQPPDLSARSSLNLPIPVPPQCHMASGTSRHPVHDAASKWCRAIHAPYPGPCNIYL